MGISDRETPGLISTEFSCELYCLQVSHLGSDLGFLRRKGWGCHNRRIGDGSGWINVSGGSYLFLVLAEVPFCCDDAFGLIFSDKSGSETRPCGEETGGDCGGP